MTERPVSLTKKRGKSILIHRKIGGERYALIDVTRFKEEQRIAAELLNRARAAKAFESIGVDSDVLSKAMTSEVLDQAVQSLGKNAFISTADFLDVIETYEQATADRSLRPLVSLVYDATLNSPYVEYDPELIGEIDTIMEKRHEYNTRPVTTELKNVISKLITAFSKQE